ncbi:MAG: SMC-Scp complex subunit ScpB [Candidatus Micrarchaeales archaeon]|nr:SMC-Scp complex subunit ScpB [Candidatus Micrarchaeales archaeon]
MGEEQDYKKLIEAALFVTSKAMSASELADVAGIASVGAVNGMIEELMKDYDSKNSAIGIFRIGEKYIMSVREPYAGKVSNLAGAPDMSKGALRILAFVSKNEPVMQSAVVKAFGSTTYDYMKELLEKEFVRTQKVGRSKRIETTEKFKEYFNF